MINQCLRRLSGGADLFLERILALLVAVGVGTEALTLDVVLCVLGCYKLFGSGGYFAPALRSIFSYFTFGHDNHSFLNGYYAHRSLAHVEIWPYN